MDNIPTDCGVDTSSHFPSAAWTKAVINGCHFRKRVILSPSYSDFNIQQLITAFVHHMCTANRACEAIDHFACNFAKCVPILKVVSPANTTIILQ